MRLKINISFYVERVYVAVDHPGFKTISPSEKYVQNRLKITVCFQYIFNFNSFQNLKKLEIRLKGKFFLIKSIMHTTLHVINCLTAECNLTVQIKSCSGDVLVIDTIKGEDNEERSFGKCGHNVREDSRVLNTRIPLNI